MFHSKENSFPLYCYTNNPHNIHFNNNDILVIKPELKWDSTLNYITKYTSAMVTSTQHWTYGRFEIRAALPVGKMLRTDIRLESAQSYGNTPKGRIDIVNEIQTAHIFYGIQIGYPAHYKPFYESHTALNLQHYHTYTVDWNETHIQWFFDKNHLHSLA